MTNGAYLLGWNMIYGTDLAKKDLKSETSEVGLTIYYLDFWDLMI